MSSEEAGPAQLTIFHAPYSDVETLSLLSCFVEIQKNAYTVVCLKKKKKKLMNSRNLEMILGSICVLSKTDMGVGKVMKNVSTF